MANIVQGLVASAGLIGLGAAAASYTQPPKATAPSAAAPLVAEAVLPKAEPALSKVPPPKVLTEPETTKAVPTPDAKAAQAITAARPLASEKPVTDRPELPPKVAVAAAAKGVPAPAAKAGPTDVPMFGGTAERNMVNLKDTGIQALPEPDKATWKADLGSRAYGGPTVANGKVIVGTNNGRPRNPRDTVKDPDGGVEPIDRGVLMTFEEGTGKFLWQAVHKKLESGNVNDWPHEGICSTPCVEGNRVYYISNRCTVVCADLNGFADGNQGFQDEGFDKKKFHDPTDVDILWELDMMKTLNVFPHNMSACSPMIIGDILYVNTANGVDEGHINIPSPEAPSFIALDKNTGKLLWRSNLPGKHIMHGQWSNPTYAEFGGVKTVVFAGGDGYIYGMSPADGDLLWRFDANPKDTKYELGGTGTKNDFIGTPVVYKNKIYIGVGQDPEHFTGIGHFWCFDPAGKKGDISPEIGEQGKPGKPNPNSAVVWHYGGADKRPLVPREFSFGRTMSTACIVDDVLYISELQGQLHCLDAKTGKKYWQYDTKGAIWGSPFYADGKVFLATESGDLFAFKHTKTPKVIDEIDNPTAKDQKAFRAEMLAKRKLVETESLIGKVEFPAAIRSTPVVANGTLYVMTENALFAFGKK